MLTDQAIRNAEPREKPYTPADGLALLTTPNGSKLWRFRHHFHALEKSFARQWLAVREKKLAGTTCINAQWTQITERRRAAACPHAARNAVAGRLL